MPGTLTNDDLRQIRAEYERHSYSIEADSGEFRAANPAQGWLLRFDGRGVSVAPREASWSWGLDLESFGRAKRNVALGPAAAVAGSGQTLTYRWGAGLEEWYFNDSRGLEHGFRVNARPAGDGPLAFRLAIRGGLRASIMTGSRGATFRGDGAALVYDGLQAWDAEGRPLPARMAARDGRVSIEVDDAGARYPLTIDPVLREASIKNNPVTANERFGAAVAMSGNTAVFGAPWSFNASQGSGSAHVFIRSGSVWSLQGVLTPSNGETGDRFGEAVAIDGDTIVVGAIAEDSDPANPATNTFPDSGAAYVFVRSGVTWMQQAILKTSDAQDSDSFGARTAILGDTIVVSATNEDGTCDGTPNAGAVYTFTRSGSTWSEQPMMRSPSEGLNAYYGISIALSGDTLAVGERGAGGTTGKVFVYTGTGGSWNLQATIVPTHADASDLFGAAMALSGDTLIAGATGEDSSATGVNGDETNNGTSSSGAAFVFVRNAGMWSQQAFLKAPAATASLFFGSAVALSGDVASVGTGNSKVVYVFERSGTSWSPMTTLTPLNDPITGGYGRVLAINGTLAFVGDPDNNSNAPGINGTFSSFRTASGAVEVFDLAGTCSYVLGATSADAAGAGATSSFSVTTLSGCPWTAASNDAWITINSGASGNGNGTVGYTVAANTGPERMGTMTIAGQTVTVTQASACAYSVSPASVNTAAAGGSGSTSVTTTNGCPWTAAPDSPWITISSGASGAGSGAVGYIVAPNTGPQARAGTIAIGGQTFTVMQAANCSYTVNPPTAIATPGGGASSLAVTAATGCGWTAASNTAWITLSSAGSGSGNGTVSYVVAPNPGAARTGTITVAGRVVTVTQQAVLTTQQGRPDTGAPFPASGSGLTGVLAFTFSDTNGATDLSVVNILINNGLDGRNACYLAYARETGTLYLIDDAGTAGGPYAGTLQIPGGTGSIANSQCTIRAEQSGAQVSGNTLTVVLNMAFSPSFAGGRTIYLSARDSGNNNSGWRPLGVWTVPGGTGGNGTAVGAANPGRATSGSLQLTTTFADSAGAADISVLNVLISNGLDATNACFVAVIRSTGALLLVNDAGVAGGPYAGSMLLDGGATGSISNSQCAILASGTSMTASGTNLTLTLNLQFANFHGDKIVYAAARDVNGNNSSWQPVGTATIP
ncbi:MAG: BACON domain-containing carbohydrate-binding protein [Bryobacteraceae bacterium]